MDVVKGDERKAMDGQLVRLHGSFAEERQVDNYMDRCLLWVILLNNGGNE